MKFGITGVNAAMGAVPEYALGLARAAEETGIESLWTVEHVVVPEGYDSTYPYSKTGKMPGGGDVPITDPLVWLSYVAAVTERIKLGTAIIILPQRNPVVFAKEVATLDVLSGGRVLLGVGIGWLKEEFDAIGVPFEQRGARTDDYVAAMRVLWREPVPTYRGTFASFEGAKQYPKPV
ncbi:MAG TPA: TIGR03619 family F420-dependent LLM class oxidoreductase, partial [Actinomycetota bacterium]|nr:TIGR03619 family F420-dependent LLM class oxidoreductase [Actinomycetota bacterium]